MDEELRCTLENMAATLYQVAEDLVQAASMFDDLAEVGDDAGSRAKQAADVLANVIADTAGFESHLKYRASELRRMAV